MPYLPTFAPPDKVWARFVAKIVIDPCGCWLWTAAQNGAGYGRFWNGETLEYAHRFSYRIYKGPIPEGHEIDHVKDRGCLHKHCVFPEHLEAVTHRENDLRGTGVSAVNAAKTHCPRGHSYSGKNLKFRKTGRRRCVACETYYNNRRA